MPATPRPARPFLLPAAALVALVGGPVPADAAEVARSGQVEIALNLKTGAAIPDGTEVSISVSGSAADAARSNFSSTNAEATVSGGRITATLSLYYTWLVSAKEQATVAVSVTASKGSYSVSSSFGCFAGEVPPPNAVTHCAIDSSL